MQPSKISLLALILLGIMITGFQCASTELTSAKLYIQQKNLDKAMDALKKEVEKNPKSDEGWYLLGVVYGEKGMAIEMTDAFNRSLAISNKFEKNIHELKLKHWALFFNQGVGFFQKAVKLQDKDSIEIYYNKAVYSYQQAIKIEPDSAGTYINLGYAYLALGENEKAIEPLQTIVDKVGSLNGYKYLGEVLYTMGANAKAEYQRTGNAQDSIKALEYFERAITVLVEGRKKYPDDSDLLATLSNSYVGANKESIAMDAFKTGAEKEPNNEYYRYNYGVMLLGAERYEEAVEQFTKAVEIKPDYQNAIYNLAVAYVKWGTAINKAAEDKGNMQGNNYKDKYKAALPHLEKVAEMKESDIPTWELLGKVYTILGMEAEALKAFEKVDQLRKQ